jgi:transposase
MVEAVEEVGMSGRKADAVVGVGEATVYRYRIENRVGDLGARI